MSSAPESVLPNCFSDAPPVAAEVARGVTRLFCRRDLFAICEVPLPNGRRADVMAIGRRGDIVICEVKSGIEDYRCDLKWREYGPYCDAFYFATAPEFPHDVLEGDCGLIVADGFGGAMVREATPNPLAPARRKALTLAFARLGAMRTLRD